MMETCVQQCMRGPTTMTIRSSLILLAVSALAGFGAVSCERPGVRAAGENTSDLTPQKILSIDDESFLLKAQKAEITQTTLSQIALKVSTNDDIRRYARQVFTNYVGASAKLTDLMKAKNVPATTAAIEGLQLDAMNRLYGLSGSEFDHEFVSLMSAEQQAAVPIFKLAAETSADPDIRNYANSVLPLLLEDFNTVSILQK